MITLVLVAGAFAVFCIVFAVMSRVGRADRRSAADQDFAAAAASEDSLVGRWMLRLGQPLSGLDVTNPAPETPAYEALRYKLAAAGGMYAGSPVVFLSVQIACVALATLIAGILLVTGVSWLIMLVGLVIAGALAYYPWQKVSETARKRMDAVNASLPEFAELLLMPLTSGYGILPALDFTAARLPGPVSQEVQLLLTVINNRSVDERDAFDEAGRRLGTPQAQAFFTTLAQSYLEGTPAAEAIRGQAEQLRKLSYERTREKIKTLPNKLVVIMGLHLMPILFAVVLLPLAQGFGAR